jgi:DNA repair protein REV1
MTPSAQAGRRGRTVTLKLMVRAAGAPEETSKFLGHGLCDTLSRWQHWNWQWLQ